MVSVSWCGEKALGSDASSGAGYDWADRFPAIVDAASRLKAQSFLIEGEAVVFRDDGLSDFDALRSRRRREAVLLHRPVHLRSATNFGNISSESFIRY